MYIKAQMEQAVALVEEKDLPSTNLKTGNNDFSLKKLPYANEITTIDQIKGTFKCIQQQTPNREYQAVLYFTLPGVETRFWVAELAKQGNQQESLEMLSQLKVFEGKITKVQKQVPKEILWPGSYRYEYQALKLFLQKTTQETGNFCQKKEVKTCKRKIKPKRFIKSSTKSGNFNE